MKRYLKKYRFIVYAAAIMGFDLLTRGELAIGGGTVLFIGAVLASLGLEHEDKEKSHCKQ